MIEMIYNEKETDNSGEIRVPKNIRQIGEPSHKRKIYIEDYVVNTIKKQNDGDETVKYGVLLGEIKRNKEETCIFVNGLVETREVIEHSIIFNDDIWKNVNNDINNYFEGMQIVGWFASSPYISGKEMNSIKKLHLDNFAGNDKICFISDRNEKDEQIFVYEKGELKKQSGFYIYYERNDRLKKYLKQTAGERGISISAKESISSKPNNVEKSVEKTGTSEKSEKEYSSIRDLVRQYTERENSKGIRGRISYGFSGILIIALLLSTIVMLNNYGELKDLKSSIDNLNDSENVKAVNELLSSVVPDKKGENTWDSEEVKNSDSDSGELKENTNSGNDRERLKENTNSGNDRERLKENTNTANTNSANDREKSKENINSDSSSVESKGYMNLDSDSEELKDSVGSSKKAEVHNSKLEGNDAENSGASIYSGMYHTVKKGQTLYDISVSYYGTGNMVEQIKMMNGIDDDYVIKEGQKIILP